MNIVQFWCNSIWGDWVAWSKLQRANEDISSEWLKYIERYLVIVLQSIKNGFFNMEEVKKLDIF